MAYTVIPTITTGDVATAAWGNTHLKDNFAAGVPDLFTSDGDVAVGTGSNAAERVALLDSSNLVKRDRGGLEVALADPNADRILFWDDGAGAYAYLVPNTGLAISGTNLNATGIVDVVDDTTPQLGGNLDMQGHLLVGNGGSTGIAISANGEVTMAAQPAFAVPAAARANITGDGTIYTVVWGTATEDRGGDYDDISTFTCPVAGMYRFDMNCGASGYASGHTDTRITLVGANKASEHQFNGFNAVNGGTTLGSAEHHAYVECDASDTVTVTFQVGGGAKVIDLNVGIDGEFCGELVI